MLLKDTNRDVKGKAYKVLWLKRLQVIKMLDSFMLTHGVSMILKHWLKFIVVLSVYQAYYSVLIKTFCGRF
jgi:hypothetical protein